MKLKDFTNNTALCYVTILAHKDIKNLIKKAIENINKNNLFECNEEKILKLLNIFKGKITKESLKELCIHLSDEDLTDEKGYNLDLIGKINEEKINENLKNIKKTNDYNIRLVKIRKILKALLINKDRLDSILNDDELNLEKLFCFSNKEIKYLAKKPLLLKIIKKIPLKALKKLKGEK